MRTKADKSAARSAILALLFFVITLTALIVATVGFARRSREEGIQATHDAVQQAAVLCYASEGFYPPSLDYIRENYGLQIDESRYVVRYEPYAPNLMPGILVIPR